ncbi:MAG: 50S ribosomal protein L13 [Candidatus Uhrbacteria bacterium GW2011_GWE2_45_35]|uniref:Large ribosomal subunit protein uL13 n=2 Tax=Candidatus Uhriibacteriota TaxID=1752732 RepID=A0A0G1LSI8_9BACT|nr:MAG: 50S ribosomal protein L13 [Candidatus Uhrbacteria bacterium GW2011_GWF2_44_350]KKU08741.1 MAG: 50S ribosomal protein L13 [Candidatus Uhrbacteria bacterium GW2011_GWE2_45_35]HBR80751.1 50S ribosomal protein L13 [Candidatus Uhrbacteria bacterium]HCU31886.1 50S ribosomal protein L13 [Candidatus Uhrbacteria bacterium]
MPVKVERKHKTIDATDRVPGRLATEVARILIGKNKAAFTPNLDVGDFVEITNVSKMSFSGKKLERTEKHHHSGYLGGLKTQTLGTLFNKDPARVFKQMVSRMLPKNTHRTPRLKRLTFK